MAGRSELSHRSPKSNQVKTPSVKTRDGEIDLSPDIEKSKRILLGSNAIPFTKSGFFSPVASRSRSALDFTDAAAFVSLALASSAGAVFSRIALARAASG